MKDRKKHLVPLNFKSKEELGDVYGYALSCTADTFTYSDGGGSAACDATGVSPQPVICDLCQSNTQTTGSCDGFNTAIIGCSSNCMSGGVSTCDAACTHSYNVWQFGCSDMVLNTP